GDPSACEAAIDAAPRLVDDAEAGFSTPPSPPTTGAPDAAPGAPLPTPAGTAAPRAQPATPPASRGRTTHSRRGPLPAGPRPGPAGTRHPCRGRRAASLPAGSRGPVPGAGAGPSPGAGSTHP